MEELTPEVYISNISFNSDEEDLRRCCAKFGDIAKIQLLKKNGIFRGAANVLFRKLECASAMAAQSDRVRLDGRPLRIKQQPTRTAVLYSEHTSVSLKQGRIQFGHIGTKPNVFVPIHKVPQPMAATFSMAQRKIVWELQFQLKIVIDFKDIDGDITSAITVEGPSITLSLYRPARMYKYDNHLSQSKGDPWRRYGEPKLLDHFGACLVHHVVFPPYEQQKADALMYKLAEFKLARHPVVSFPILIIPPAGLNQVAQIKEELSKLPFATLFKVESLISNGILPPYTMVDAAGATQWQEFVEALATSDQVQAVAAMDLMLERRRRVFNLKDEFTLCKELVADVKPVMSPNMVMVNRMLITPTKFYLIGPEIEVSNRVLRNYSEHLDRFLRVSFLDEDFITIGAGEIMTKSITDRFESLLISGFTIANRKYDFLAFSSSQLRMHSCWFFAPLPDIDCDSIRSWMGDFSGIRTVAKCAARMGQCFSTTYSTLNVAIDEMKLIDDIYTRPSCDPMGKTYCFTDGVGKMSFEFADAVCKALKEPEASAFQTRFKGFKGVVAKWPNMDCKLELRPSMLKFECPHDIFEVITIARYVPAHLNRQLIQLLCHAGVPDEPFVDLQKKMISDIQQMLVDAEAAKKVLTRRPIEHGTHDMMVESLSEFSIQEVFLQNILRTCAARYMRDLKLKSRIFLPKGCSLIGIIDEEGLLESGQVFIQFVNPKTRKRKILNRTVVVSKPPCLHPGDIRKLEAVDVPGLRHIVNCIVFPRKGERPHTHECSGSDLDGDRYLICWDERLIPPKQYPAGEYTTPKAKEVPSVTIRDIIQFFVNYIQNDSLGMIAHAHMAIADHESPNHKDCLQLAHLHSIAVDFPKTGVPAQMTSQLRPELYSDFMDKRDKPTYESIKVIGVLYRQIAPPTLSLKATSWDDVQVDPDLVYPNYEEYVEEALEAKKQYNFNSRSIMNQFGVKHESEALSGHILKFHKHMRNKDQETTQTVRKAIHSLRTYWREEFFREFENPDFGKDKYSETERMRKEKASAWYLVTYDHRKYNKNLQQGEMISSKEEKGKELSTKELFTSTRELVGREEKTVASRGGHEDFLLSFPWVVHDVLCEIKKEKLSTR